MITVEIFYMYLFTMSRIIWSAISWYRYSDSKNAVFESVIFCMLFSMCYMFIFMNIEHVIYISLLCIPGRSFIVLYLMVQ